MFQALLRMLTSPIKFKKAGAATAAQKKHLVMQTLYPKPYYNPYEPIEPITVDIDLLIKQQQILMSHPSFTDAVIEIHLLNKNAVLVGFTRHPQTILNGIFMYPRSVHATDSWIDVVSQANQRKTNIAVFRPRQDIDCLKVTKNDGKKSTLYLVDHRAIVPVEMMHQPA